MKLSIAYPTFIVASIAMSEIEARIGRGSHSKSHSKSQHDDPPIPLTGKYTVYFANPCSNEVSVTVEDHTEVIPPNNCHVFNGGKQYIEAVTYKESGSGERGGNVSCKNIGSSNNGKCDLMGMRNNACVVPIELCGAVTPIPVTAKPTSTPTPTPPKPSPGTTPRTLYFSNHQDRDQQAGILDGGGRSGKPINSLMKKDIKANSCVLVSDDFTAPFNSQLNDSFYYFTSEAYLPVTADPDLISPKLVDGDTCNENSINMIMPGGECNGLVKMPQNACVVII